MIKPILQNTARRFFNPRERYQRPHNYSIVTSAVAGVAVCLSPNRQRMPVKVFVVQSDVVNGGNVNIGDGTANLVNGIQLIPGSAWIFNVGAPSFAGQGAMFPTPMQFTESVQYQKNQIGKLPYEDQVETYLDIADYFAVATAAAQIVRIFWSTDPK